MFRFILLVATLVVGASGVKSVIWAGPPLNDNVIIDRVHDLCACTKFDSLRPDQVQSNGTNATQFSALVAELDAIGTPEDAPWMRAFDFNCHMNWRDAEDRTIYYTQPPCENDKVYMARVHVFADVSIFSCSRHDVGPAPCSPSITPEALGSLVQ
jgi:hypothetical protein